MTLSSLERTERALNFQSVDKVPVIPLIIQHAVKLRGVWQHAYSTDPKVLVECQVAALRKYGYDGIHITSDNWILPESLGREVHLQEVGPPVAGPPPLVDTTDLSGLRRPDPYNDYRMPLLIEATRTASALIGQTHYIKTNFDQGPFTLATALRGMQEFMLDLYDNPDFATSLLEFCADVVASYGVAVASSGAHGVTFGDASAGLLSRDLYEAFALPYQKRVIEEIHSKAGVPVFLHICGDTRHILDLMAESGADALELDSNVNLAEAKEKTQGKVCLSGNIDTTRVLLHGTEEEVIKATSQCMESVGGGLDGGFILSSGCEVPRDTPSENLAAMMSARNQLL